METVEFIVVTLLGLAGIVYAFNSHDIRFYITDKLPGKLSDRKIVFTLGLAVILFGFALSYVIGDHHSIISLIGGWIMLAGSTQWFDKRIVRKFFAPEELKVIRITIFAGLIITVLSTGLLRFPNGFSPGSFLLGISLMFLAGRLWWNQDPSIQNRIMQQSKRNYS